MNRFLFILCAVLVLFSACTKNCPNVDDAPFSDEEKKFFLPSASAYYFANGLGDTQIVSVNPPVYYEIPNADKECDRPGSQGMDQLWKINGQNISVKMEHFTNEGDGRYLRCSYSGQEIFRYDVVAPTFTTIQINTQYYNNTMVDSTSNAAVSPLIRKLWYGKHTGILRYETWSGIVWNRQKSVN